MISATKNKTNTNIDLGSTQLTIVTNHEAGRRVFYQFVLKMVAGGATIKFRSGLLAGYDQEQCEIVLQEVYEFADNVNAGIRSCIPWSAELGWIDVSGDDNGITLTVYDEGRSAFTVGVTEQQVLDIVDTVIAGIQ